MNMLDRLTTQHVMEIDLQENKTIIILHGTGQFRYRAKFTKLEFSALIKELRTLCDEMSHEYIPEQYERNRSNDELPLYNAESACPKCGWGKIKTRWIGKAFPDVMLRTCERCKDHWYERPLDMPRETHLDLETSDTEKEARGR